MRLRNKPWAADLIAANPSMILVSPEDIAGKWQTRFAKEQPIYIEVGSGKGQFITQMAQKYPDRNFIAVEIQESAIAVILQKQVELKLPNLQLLLGNGAALTTFFAENEVAGVYLNFSDPWPKTRHEKRRLTYKSFLAEYQQIMQPTGYLRFKTDNQGLFEYSLMSLNDYGMVFDDISLDLHNSELAEDNIQTEYEEKFSKRGQVIYRLEAHYK
ncbi:MULTISPECIES: tRNA (guanosine(46)-N7)-methyltransferase TrmB [Latilactobacillus]|jgi:tRNA (guanine-N7-)-methyltransferase|uniref:tRNA (guanine-N(7)-)-methyltransferase n=1 Tax=Latilactobacillus curvatus TaxID=28038 RepID=A0A0B2XP97_LATCU|nr:tRNA (guanosine(46)-N7)-methyltransferase TrmB [Latilactobacillus curvatus]ANJ69048.1 tRNA (guanosine(46)-N7)-methyltransferase TrmB [Latilactobacillus curvatus]ANY14161.1 tRNA (guanosine(46)-N7)-methyltransferase TrmB [Latilactobacillus curvatus]AOO75820.1 tRNA (guanosine(46)-N7)-methyltransferase TrmB [Latilactobacillus curvatus]ASN62402.1 tRNA (guanosine(46)-N7)-methyltransferase TrmB [Latilactobacillus curvatus]AWV73309.1 tRNA (guanosine(46)-N7)-methyltransferase TrmB [Latilactobacillus